MKKKFFYGITKDDYNDYKEKIKNDSIDTLNFKRVELQTKISPVDSNIVYVSILLAFGSFIFSDNILKSTFQMNSPEVFVITFFVLIIIAFIYNAYKSSKNTEYEAKIEIIKIRIEELKQEEINRKRELELNKILNQENKTLISKLIRLFLIK